MTQKIIFFDIDGTLLNDEKELPKSAEQSIRKLQAKGHHIAIATGRAPFLFKDLREKLDIHTYISLNGQYVVHDGEVIYKQPLHFHELHRLVQLSEERNHPILYLNEEEWRANSPDNKIIRKVIGTLKTPHKIIFDAPLFGTDHNLQAVLFCDEGDKKLYKDTFDSFEFVRWHDYAVDILPKGGSKALGIQHLLNALEIKRENAYSFGDGLNDVEMFHFIPNSVAMGNALDTVKKAAAFVTKPVDDDGIAHGLKKVELLT